MRIVLHIGTEKTGTTTIQRFLRMNQDVLRQAGVLVPTSAYGRTMPNHVKLPAYARDPDRPLDDMQIRLGMSPEERYNFCEEFREQFLAECRGSNCRMVVLSSEHCSSRLVTESDVARLKDLLDEIGETEILVYLRRQDEFLASGYNTRTRQGSNETLELPGPKRKGRYRYDELLKRWANIFGRKNIIVRVFSRSQFVNGDLIDDFVTAARLGVDASSLQRPPPQNESLDELTLEFLRRFNKHLPHAGRHTSFLKDPRQGNLIAILTSLSAGKKISLPAQKAREFVAEFEEGNRRIALEYLGRSDGVLFDPVADDAPAEDLTKLDLDKAFEMFATIWAEANIRRRNRRKQ